MKNFLHVGCGHKRKHQTTAGFNVVDWNEKRLDIDKSVFPDVLGSMTDMSALSTGVMQAIFSSHNIEHLYPHEVPLALAEFLRVLSLDGFAVITCPDLQSVCSLIANDQLLEPAYISPAGPISPIDILFGHRHALAHGNLFMAHRCGFTKRALSATLQSAGFQSVIVVARPSHFDLWALASKSNLTDHDLLQLANDHFPIKVE